jgi:hypothetical protein
MFQREQPQPDLRQRQLQASLRHQPAPRPGPARAFGEASGRPPPSLAHPLDHSSPPAALHNGGRRTIAARSQRRGGPHSCAGLGRSNVHRPKRPVCNDFSETVAPRAGFEPATDRLTADCSTAELPGNAVSARAGPPRRRGYSRGASRRARGQTANCSMEMRSSSACSGSNSKVSERALSTHTSTRSMSRTSY